MKTTTKMILISIIFLMTTACATTPFKLADKYNLDNELTETKEIYKFRVKSWDVVDYQSLIIQTDVNDYYLIVLRRPTRSLPYAENIVITDSFDGIKPGLDNVVVEDSAGVESYVIQKIYKLKDRQQVQEIKKRLVG
jgi:hypothetical protein